MRISCSGVVNNSNSVDKVGKNELVQEEDCQDVWTRSNCGNYFVCFTESGQVLVFDGNDIVGSIKTKTVPPDFRITLEQEAP